MAFMHARAAVLGTGVWATGMCEKVCSAGRTRASPAVHSLHMAREAIPFSGVVGVCPGKGIAAG